MNEIVVASSNGVTAMAFPMSASSARSEGSKVPKPELDDDSAKFILWGDNNTWPQDTWKAIEENDVAPMVIDWKKRALISGGLIYGARYVEDGQEVFKQIMLNEVEQFFETSCIHTNYIPGAAHDLLTYKTFFPKFIMNKARTAEKKKITELYREDPQFTRMGKQDKTKGFIKKVWVSGKFKDGDLSPEDLKDHPAVDRYDDVLAQLKEAKTHIYYPMFNRLNGNIAYEIPSWYGLQKSKWLELAKHIPIWKASIMSNSASIKYLFIIHPSYWTSKFKDWNELKDEDKFEKKKTEVTNALNALTGTDKAGKALFTETVYDEESDKIIPAWQIERIDNTKQGGDYIEDSQEADFHIIRAFGVDPTLIGQTPGAKMGAGSGSDKRVAFNHYMLLCKPEQDAICEPLQWAATLNGWHELAQKEVGIKNAKLTFRFKNYHIAKLELGHEVAPQASVDGNGDKKEKDGPTD